MKLGFQAGFLYFAGVFAIGFILGGVRLMILLPLLGETWAVVLELPVILGFCWVLCARAISRIGVPAVFAERAAMGISALVLLLLAEYMLWLLMFSNGSDSFLHKYSTGSGVIGLMGQFIFALFPIVQATLIK